jgi:LacI family transcriptional regulator
MSSEVDVLRKSPVRKRRRPTQADIARAANVSTATVSRVLNVSPLVRPDVRSRVERAIRKLGYFPHGAARALASNRSFTVGAIIPTLSNAIFATGVHAFEARLAQADYTILLAVSNYSAEAEAIQVQRLLERGVDALMLVGNDHTAPTTLQLRRAGKAYVNTWTFDAASRHPNVGFSNRKAIAQVADHLVSLGHRDIGMLAGITAGNDRALDRVEGLREALAMHGLQLAPRWFAEVPYSIGAARQAFGQMAERGALPTALVCGNDVIALGALFEALERGIAVPRDLSITGFDDLALVEHIRPALTTVHLAPEEMGAAAADALLTALESGRPVQSRELEARLLVRATTAPPSSSLRNGHPA